MVGGLAAGEPLIASDALCLLSTPRVAQGWQTSKLRIQRQGDYDDDRQISSLRYIPSHCFFDCSLQ